jgi:hypothetical protein
MVRINMNLEAVLHLRVLIFLIESISILCAIIIKVAEIKE